MFLWERILTLQIIFSWSTPPCCLSHADKPSLHSFVFSRIPSKVIPKSSSHISLWHETIFLKSPLLILSFIPFRFPPIHFLLTLLVNLFSLDVAFFWDTLSFSFFAFYRQSNPHSYANPLPLPSCPTPAAPAAVGPLTQFKQKGLHHPTAVDDEGGCQNRHADAAADQTSLGMSLLVLMVLKHCESSRLILSGHTDKEQ